MNREEIIRLARESELLTTVELIVAEQQQILFTAYKQVWMPDNLEAFAALIAAAEREACEKVASDYADYQRSLGDEYAELRAMGALEVMDKISARGEQG